VRLLRDEKQRSKGFCFIDLYDRASLIACLAEDGAVHNGRAIKVHLADHPNAPAASHSGRASGKNSLPGSRNNSRPVSPRRPGNSASGKTSRNSSRKNSRRSSPERGAPHAQAAGAGATPPSSECWNWRSPGKSVAQGDAGHLHGNKPEGNTGAQFAAVPATPPRRSGASGEGSAPNSGKVAKSGAGRPPPGFSAASRMGENQQTPPRYVAREEGVLGKRASIGGATWRVSPNGKSM